MSLIKSIQWINCVDGGFCSYNIKCVTKTISQKSSEYRFYIIPNPKMAIVTFFLLLLLNYWPKQFILLDCKNKRHYFFDTLKQAQDYANKVVMDEGYKFLNEIGMRSDLYLY